MYKFPFLVMVLLFVLIGNMRQSYACTCTTTSSMNKTEREVVQNEYGGSSFVFTGKVLKIKKSYSVRTKNGIEYVKADKVTFQIINNWKGLSSKTIIIKPSMTCGFGFKDGKTYLVYANLEQLFFDDEGKQPAGKQIDVSACSRTTIISEGKKDIEFLKEIINAKDKTGGNLKTIQR